MLIKSKLAPPHHANDALLRQALVDRLVASGKPVMIINAPAGYGKTTLLAQCHRRWREEDVVAAWYSADEGRFESDQFFAYVMAALFEAGLPLPYPRDAIEAGLPGLAIEAAARAVALALEASEEPVRLIIDDYHRIASEATDAFLDYVIQRLPAHAAILLASRGGTSLRLASLRVRGELLTLGQSDLRFSDDEVRRFFADSGTVEHAALIERTEGWPAVLQLLRLTGHTGRDDLYDLTRRSSDLADYLAEQVFAGLSPELQHFLLHTSIATRISAPLADAITGTGDGEDRLEEIRRLNLLATPLDNDFSWLRYHPLLSEFLLNRLRRLAPDRPDELHRRAARWYADAGLLADALYHASRIADDDAALAIMEAAGGWRMALRGGLAILRYLTGVTLHHPFDYPRVWLAQAYLAAQEGRLAEARAAIDRMQGDPMLAERIASDDALEYEIMTNDIVTRIYEDRPIPPAYQARIEARLAAGVDDPKLQTLLTHLLCLCAFDAGNDLWCRAHGEKAQRLAVAAQIPLVETYLYQYLGLALLRRGRRREAELLFQRGLEHSTRNFGEGSAQVAIAGILLAHTNYLSGALARAAELIDTGIAVIETSEGWHDIFIAAYATSGWMALRAGDTAKAEQVLARGLATAAARDLPRLRYQLALLRVRFRLFAGDIDQADLLLRALGEPGASMVARDARLECDYRIAAASIELARGKVCDGLLRDLDQTRAERGSVALDVEIQVLRAAELIGRGQARDGVLVFRQTIELAESEGLVALIIQFGALLLAILPACREAMHLFEPAQRTLVERLFQSANRNGAGPWSMPPAHDVIVSPREIDVLRALADGLSSKEIARSLGVAESTIKTHRINIYRKLNVATRSKALLAARTLQLI